MRKMLLLTNLHSVNGEEEDIDSLGTATAKFVEQAVVVVSLR